MNRRKGDIDSVAVKAIMVDLDAVLTKHGDKQGSAMLGALSAFMASVAFMIQADRSLVEEIVRDALDGFYGPAPAAEPEAVSADPRPAPPGDLINITKLNRDAPITLAFGVPISYRTNDGELVSAAGVTFTLRDLAQALIPVIEEEARKWTQS